MVETSRQASVEGSHAWLDSDCLAGWMQVTGCSSSTSSLLLTGLTMTFAAHVTHTVLPHVKRCITRVTQVTLPQVTSHSLVAGVARLGSRDPNQQPISNVNHSMTELCRCDSKLFQ